jgi:RNA polymerase sigma-70 factor (ECF subfamily)
MYLRDIEQLSYDEIAETTELQLNAIRVNLSRARKKVRDEFLKLNDDGNKKNSRITASLF